MLHTTRRVLPLAVAAALVVGVSACGGGGEEPPVSPAASETASVSPSPSLDPAAQREEKAVDEAEATLTDYYSALNRTAQNGYKDWQEELVQFWGTQKVGDAQAQMYMDLAEEDGRVEGEIDVVSMDVVKYTPDAGGERADEVAIDLCSDVSNVTIYVGDKVDPEGKSANDRFMSKYVMQYHPDDEVWTIHGIKPDPERSC